MTAADAVSSSKRPTVDETKTAGIDVGVASTEIFVPGGADALIASCSRPTVHG